MEKTSKSDKQVFFQEGESRKGRIRRQKLIDAARDLYEEKGLSKTSVLDITERVGVTRSLYYHYFKNKNDITTAVLDTYVDDFVEALHYWNEHRVPGSTEQSLRSLLQIFRSFIFENNSFRLDLASTVNASLYLRFVQRVADQITRFLIEAAVDDYAALYPVEIENIYESIYALLSGLIALIRSNPDIDQEIIVQISIQTLHLKVGMDKK